MAQVIQSGVKQKHNGKIYLLPICDSLTSQGSPYPDPLQIRFLGEVLLNLKMAAYLSSSLLPSGLHTLTSQLTVVHDWEITWPLQGSAYRLISLGNFYKALRQAENYLLQPSKSNSTIGRLIYARITSLFVSVSCLITPLTCKTLEDRNPRLIHQNILPNIPLLTW